MGHLADLGRFEQAIGPHDVEASIGAAGAEDQNAQLVRLRLADLA
jgi:hypothetical protein